MDPGQAAELELMQRQLLMFAKDLQKIVGQERLRREQAEDALRDVQSQQLAVVRTLAFVCEAKDNYTRQHLDRTYNYAMRLTHRVAPDVATEAAIHYGYLLHDIGKVGVPDNILNKPAPLDDDEWKVMRTHPLIGLQLVKPIRFLGDAIGIIRSHHERWDGRGYPEGVAGEDIYLPARIFSIIDTFDAMTSDRPYRKGCEVHVALEEIDRCAGNQFDPDLVTEFLKLCDELGVDEAGDLSIVR